MAEALLNKADVAPENRDDWEEVQNYVAAIKEAIAALLNRGMKNRRKEQ